MILKYILTFLISMVPVIELRGAIPFGLSPAMGDALPIIPCYIVAVLGNMIPVPFIFFLARKLLTWGQNKKFIGGYCSWCIKKGNKASEKLSNKKSVYIGLMLFVGIPLPGTGAWTGTLAASFLDLDFKKSSIAIMAGVILAGIIMGLASLGIFGAAGAMFAK